MSRCQLWRRAALWGAFDHIRIGRVWLLFDHGDTGMQPLFCFWRAPAVNSLLTGFASSNAPSAHQRSQHDVPSRAGLLYAASLWLSNASYLYLSVSFIQMTKSLMPGLVYASGVVMGTEKYSPA